MAKATNQSTRLNRRAVLAGAAAAAVPVPALAAGLNDPDPIFAAIAARAATWAAWGDSPHDEDGDIRHDLVDDDTAAVRVMLLTPPTTLQGIKALLRYIVECEEDGELLNFSLKDDADEYERPAGEILARTLLTALERL
jgi:hypothetical protein